MAITKSEDTDQLPRRRLPLWVALALSVATVGPTLAMSGNRQASSAPSARLCRWCL